MTTAATDPERILQIRNIEPSLKRELRIECATEDMTHAQLLAKMWQAYRAHQRVSRGAGSVSPTLYQD